MEKIKSFMQGRNGGDGLSMGLLILSILLSFIGRITKSSLVIILSYIPIGISLFRIFSKNVQKRRMENYKFAVFISPLYSKFKNAKDRVKDRKTYKYYRCPSCNQQLRVPKNKGKIIITCSNCRNKFEKTT